MVIHYCLQNVCDTSFLIAKMDKEIFNDKKKSEKVREQLLQLFNVPVYLLCEETEEKTRGDIEWIRGYIHHFEPRLAFDILEVE